MERIEYAKTGGGCPKFVIYEYDEHGREEFKERDLRPDENLESTRYDPLPILTGRVTLELPRRSKRPKRYLMAYPGNLKGPRESELIQKLGHEYFGITPGRPYTLFSRPNLRPQRFYFLEHGLVLRRRHRNQDRTTRVKVAAS